MTLYLARKVGSDNTVDETLTIYLGICDDCRHMVDHRDEEIVLDALDGHRVRAHANRTYVDPEAPHQGWMTFTSAPDRLGVAPEPEARPAKPYPRPDIAPVTPAPAPSPVPRGEQEAP